MTERDLRLLVQNGAAPEVRVVRHGSGFMVTVNGQPLESARQDVRPFASLDTVARVLGQASVPAFTVQLT